MLKIQKWLNHTSRIIMTFSVIALNASAFQMMKLDNATDIELHTGAFIYHIKRMGAHMNQILKYLYLRLTQKEGIRP